MAPSANSYTYDYGGRMKTMITWSTFNPGTETGTGARVTTWNYHAQRGWLVSKDYPNKDSGQAQADSGPRYEYTPGGRLALRTWRRPGAGGAALMTRYKYGFDASSQFKHGDLWKVEYENDPAATPNLTYTYDRLGRRQTVGQGAITTTLDYNDANQPLTETYGGGILNGLAVNWTYNNVLQRETLSLGGVSGYGVGYAYDAAGRLRTVSEGSSVTTYGYEPDSMLVCQVASVQGAVSLTTAKAYDVLNRLASISSVAAGSAAVPMPIRYGYRYNKANQRDRVTLADNSYWDYAHDDLGQVTAGKHRWQDTSFVAGQQFEYLFDHIGNRTSTKVGGDASGGALRAASYNSDQLNRYAQREVSGYADILGLAVPSTAVTVNGNSAYRKGEYFHYALPVDNNSAAQYPTVTVASGVESSSGKVFIPKTPEVFDYDADGNLLSDGRWNYTWDAENRLVKVESLATGQPSGSRRRLDFACDYLGRRIWSKITNLDTSTVLSETKFLYDGWNLIAELAAANSVIRTYVWGTDLSGTFQGAGGVGGLLKVNLVAAPATTCFAAYDGNGNVAGLINAANGTVVASYEYGPFGEVIRATGPMAKANPFRFSTKYQDDETDLVYYGYRYYNASTGRWLSRDPIEEEGDDSLYLFVRNSAVSSLDPLGLSILSYQLFAEWLVGWNGMANHAKYNYRELDWSDFDQDGSTEESLKQRWLLANRPALRRLCDRTPLRIWDVYPFVGDNVTSTFNSREPWISAYEASAGVQALGQKVAVRRDVSCCCIYEVTLHLHAEMDPEFRTVS